MTVSENGKLPTIYIIDTEADALYALGEANRDKHP